MNQKSIMSFASGRIFPAMLFLLAGLWATLAGDAHAAVTIQHWETAKGARVYFVENHDLPLLDVRVEFAAGSAYDDPAKSGTANLTLHMLSLGAGGLGEDEIARRIADVGAQLNGNFDQDRAGVGLRTLSSAKERDQALGILAKIIQSPEFPTDIVNREKARIVASLEETDVQPGTIASKRFYRALYGTHPYAMQPSGEKTTVSAIGRDDVTAFYRKYYTARNATISIMGDVSRAEAERIADALTGALPAGEPRAALPAVPTPESAKVELVAHPASQSHVLVGFPGVFRGDPDYFPLYVGNYILGGGGFDSRLTSEIREKRGLAYSTYSYFLPLERKGPFQMGLQTKKDQTAEALGIMRSVLARFIEQGPTGAEVKQAKANLIGGFPLRIDSNKDILEYVAMIGFYGLPLDYLDRFTAQVDKVDARAIRDAFQRRIDPARMAIVVVGADGKQVAQAAEGPAGAKQ